MSFALPGLCQITPRAAPNLRRRRLLDQEVLDLARRRFVRRVGDDPNRAERHAAPKTDLGHGERLAGDGQGRIALVEGLFFGGQPYGAIAGKQRPAMDARLGQHGRQSLRQLDRDPAAFAPQ